MLKQVLLSDCIDYGEILFGARQEGTYQAISSLIHLWATFLGRAVPIAVLSGVVGSRKPGNDQLGALAGLLCLCLQEMVLKQ